MADRKSIGNRYRHICVWRMSVEKRVPKIIKTFEKKWDSILMNCPGLFKTQLEYREEPTNTFQYSKSEMLVDRKAINDSAVIAIYFQSS